VKKGSTPIWNYNFSIEVQSLNDKIKIKCIEESLPNKGFIGETILSVSSLISSDNWIPLYDNKAGENS
jgi:Ca2+-dependent lipid-binding protein